MNVDFPWRNTDDWTVLFVQLPYLESVLSSQDQIVIDLESIFQSASSRIAFVGLPTVLLPRQVSAPGYAQLGTNRGARRSRKLRISKAPEEVLLDSSSSRIEKR